VAKKKQPDPDGNRNSSSLGRRTFLGSALSLAYAGAKTSSLQAAASTPLPAHHLGCPLWCDKGGLIEPTQPSREKEVRQFIQKCFDHGVTRLFPWTGSRVLVAAAHEKNIRVDPYLAFNSHGRKRRVYSWSLDYPRSPIESPQAKRLLDQHRPIWSHPSPDEELTDFAAQHPGWWALDRDHTRTLEMGGKRLMSLVVPEVRAHEIELYLALLDDTGGDGIQVEFVSLNEDANGITIFGYESPMVDAFRRASGKDPKTLSNQDPDWVQFRADQVTECMRELRQRLKRKDPNAVLSVAASNREQGDYIKVGQDWSRWVAEDLFDEYYLWFPNTSDLETIGRQVSQMAEIVAGRRPLVAEISCYHLGSIQDPKRLLQAARRAKANGADSVGLYRSHSVDQLDLWPVVSQIARLFS
jgi:hypothetical protein